MIWMRHKTSMSRHVKRTIVVVSGICILGAGALLFFARGNLSRETPVAALSGLGGLWHAVSPSRTRDENEADETSEVPAAHAPNESQQAAAAASAPELSDWSLYENVDYGFLLRHPREMRVSEFEESAGDMVLFESAGDEGMQIFITPWDEGGEVMTLSRIRQDLPKLLIVNQQTALLEDGHRALIFESAKDGVGATREVWIIAGDYLYQISAPIAFDTTLSWIMATWRFE
jgi:hypothetical protein